MNRHFLQLSVVSVLALASAAKLGAEEHSTERTAEPYSQNQRDAARAPAGMPTHLEHGYELYRSKCGSCHSLARAQKKSNLSSDEWGDIVYRMRDMASSHINEAQAKAILDVVVWDDQHRTAANKAPSAAATK